MVRSLIKSPAHLGLNPSERGFLVSTLTAVAVAVAVAASELIEQAGRARNYRFLLRASLMALRVAIAAA